MVHPTLVDHLQRRLDQAATASAQDGGLAPSLLDGFAQATWEADADGSVIADSPSWRAYTGQSAEERSGFGWLAAVHSEDRGDVERQWREAVAAPRPIDIEFRLHAAGDGWRWTNMRALPSLDADGSVQKWVGINLDVDARRRAENAMRESEARLRAFVTASSDVIYRMSPDWSEMRQLDGRTFLDDTTAPTSGWMARYIPPDEQAEVGRAIHKAIRTRSLFELEHRVRRADGTLGWTLSRAAAILDEAGEIVEWLGSAKDVTDRRQAQERLRESEERFRQFADASFDALWIRDAGTLTMEYVSPAFEKIYGVARHAVIGPVSRWTELILAADRKVALEHIERARAGETVVHEFRIRRPSDGAVRWIRNTDFPLHDERGRIQRVGGIAEDVTEVTQAGERQAVLIAELQHRTRNLLAVVRSIASETMEHAGSMEAFRDTLSDRLSALSRVQGLLSRSEAEPITIGTLVRLELDALGAGGSGGQFVVDGPEVFLKPSTVQTLALALHELGTNARKYGALSHERGRLAVTWRERIEGSDHRLALEWVESGLEHVPDTAGSGAEGGGYGRELIEHALPHALGARTSYALTASGVRCTIDMPARPGNGGSDDANG